MCVHGVSGRVHAPEHLSRHRHGHRRAFVGEFVGQGNGGGVEIVGRVQGTDQAALPCLAGRKHAAGIAPLQRGRQAHGAGQKPGGGGFRRDAAPAEHEAELGGFGSDPDVHGKLHGRADAHRCAVDGANHGLEAAKDAQRGLAATVAPVVLAGALVVVEGIAARRQVGAGTEGTPAPGHDHRPHVVVGVGVIKRRDDLVLHLRREGVHLLGPVQPQGGDAVVDVERDGRELRCGHGVSLRL